ncbi:doublecortin domain-containing protein 2B [Hemiscyllium ocellatum]|uniref:doublecortin domain-containing protein 2B n=1 Tax=Hemiscyllium ocellatum TaxID=170820 RepID=UPI002966D2BC|nr:doublecortin domain-containing protein 2B [Hemiscyllium ocellatum]
MASAGTPLVPQAKNVVVFRNGDPFFTGRKLVVNQRQILTFESFLNEVTNNINAPVAVRNIYTPSGGHRVLQLNDLQNGSHYVAAGFEKFKKIAYLKNGNPKPKENRGKVGITVRAVYSNRVNVSARWKKYIPIPCIVHIFRNGDVLNPPFRLIIPKHVITNWDKILAMITEKAKIRTGAVRRLCTVSGQIIDSGGELESGQYYVAVGSEKFKHLPYLELLVCKMSSQNAYRVRGDCGITQCDHLQLRGCRHGSDGAGGDGKETHRRTLVMMSDGDFKICGSSNHNLGMSSQKQSGSSFANGILMKIPNYFQSDKRRVQSTGDAGTGQILVSPQMVKRKGRKTNSQESIIFAKPVRVKTNRNLINNPHLRDSAKDKRSVFKVTEKRAELQGAQEIPDDENTKVELPIDKRVAETVEDEVIPEEETISC